MAFTDGTFAAPLDGYDISRQLVNVVLSMSMSFLLHEPTCTCSTSHYADGLPVHMGINFLAAPPF